MEDQPSWETENTFGNTLQHKGNFTGAIRHYRSAIRLNPTAAGPHFNLATCLFELSKQKQQQAHISAAFRRKAKSCYQAALELKPEWVEALSNLSVLHMKDDELHDALNCLNKATMLQLTPSSPSSPSSPLLPSLPDAFWNLNCVMRRLGRKEESISLSKGYIEAYISTRTKLTEADMSDRYDDGNACNEDKYNVVCVKWGRKYGAEYVLRLFRGIRRHMKQEFTFICFTDDSSGLEDISEITCEKLPSGWEGWWNKAALFGPLSTCMRGRVLYVDLDTVITGPLDELWRCAARFAILSTKDLDNEGKDFSNGLNSSLVLWNANDEEIKRAVYGQLERNFDIVHAFIHRFDHWLELTVRNPCILQDEFPGIVVEFKHACEENVPIGASIVVFPLHPKPHQCLDVSWVRQHWLLDETDSNEIDTVSKQAG